MQREKFLSTFLQESIKKRTDFRDQITIYLPDGRSSDFHRGEDIIFLRFLLWCCSSSSFAEVGDTTQFTRLRCREGSVWDVCFMDLTSGGYALSTRTGIQPSALALLRGAHKYSFPRITELMIKMLSLDVESAIGRQNEQMHLLWEMLMRQVWYHLYQLEKCGPLVSFDNLYNLGKQRNQRYHERIKALLVDVSQPPCEPLKMPKDLSGLVNCYALDEQGHKIFPEADLIIPEAQGPGGDLIVRVYQGHHPQPAISIHQDKIRGGDAFSTWDYEKVHSLCMSKVEGSEKPDFSPVLFVWASFCVRQIFPPGLDDKKTFVFMSRNRLIEMYGPLIPGRLRASYQNREVQRL